MLIVAFIMNLIIIFCESLTLGCIRYKWDILKYYTYLQNFIALITSLIFCISLVISVVWDITMPELVKGLRYIATSGLLVTTIVFVVFLGAGKKINITEDDFLFGFNPKLANIVLHYICPMLSLLSFVFFERDINLTNDIWTGVVAIPSCIYWAIYIILSTTKLWEEPYNFTSFRCKNKILDIMSILIIPLSFIAISFVLWNVN